MISTVLCKGVKVKVAQSCLTLCDPMDYTDHGILQARILEWVAFPFSRGSSQPGIKPRSPTLQTDSLPAEPQGKTKNTGVGSLSLLQRIFPIQEPNWGLLHCRQFSTHWTIREVLAKDCKILFIKRAERYLASDLRKTLAMIRDPGMGTVIS